LNIIQQTASELMSHIPLAILIKDLTKRYHFLTKKMASGYTRFQMDSMIRLLDDIEFRINLIKDKFGEEAEANSELQWIIANMLLSKSQSEEAKKILDKLYETDPTAVTESLFDDLAVAQKIAKYFSISTSSHLFLCGMLWKLLGDGKLEVMLQTKSKSKVLWGYTNMIDQHIVYDTTNNKDGDSERQENIKKWASEIIVSLLNTTPARAESLLIKVYKLKQKMQTESDPKVQFFLYLTSVELCQSITKAEQVDKKIKSLAFLEQSKLLSVELENPSVKELIASGGYESPEELREKSKEVLSE